MTRSQRGIHFHLDMIVGVFIVRLFSDSITVTKLERMDKLWFGEANTELVSVIPKILLLLSVLTLR